MLKRKIWLVLLALTVMFGVNSKACLAIKCTEGQLKCDKQDLQQWCQNPKNTSEYIWVTIKTCDSNETCDVTINGCRSEAIESDCKNSKGSIIKTGSRTCGTDSTIIYKCDNGTLIEDVQCTSEDVCNSDSGTPYCVSSGDKKCTEGQYSCGGKKLYGWCKVPSSEYKWTQIDTCTSNEYCDSSSGTCKISTASDLTCTNNDGKTIKSGKTTCGKNTNYIYTCNNGVLDGGELCSGGRVCNDSSGTPTCGVTDEVKEAADASGGYDPFGSCGGSSIDTALGCIPTEMSNFVPWLMTWLFGVAGGIAFLLMAYGFILIATSSGDEKKIQGAKETITSAIVGLLVCIFAVFILRLIAVNILKIPGI